MAVATPPILSPIAIGQIVARNIVPVVGAIALGWPAINVLLLYFVDTMLSMGVLFAGLASYFSRQQSEDSAAARINGEAGAIAVAVFVCAFIAVPLGMPLVLVGAWSGWERFESLMSDPGFLSGLAWQAVAAIGSYWGLWQELRVRTPEELRLKRRFALVFLRWIVIVGVVYTPLVWLFGRFMPHVLVVLYVATSIVIEIAPDRFLRLMPGGAENATPRPGPAPKRYSRTKERS